MKFSKISYLALFFSCMFFGQKYDYQKISEKEKQYFLSKEDNDHKLGSVSLHLYKDSPKTELETSYKWEEVQFVFSDERKYIYDDKDSLVYYSQYSEIPSAHDPELIEKKYGYDKNIATIKTYINGELDSEVSTKIERNSNGKIIAEISPNKIATTEYNQLGAILKETVKEENSPESVKIYSYHKNGNLSKTDYSNPEFEVLETSDYNEDGKKISTITKQGSTRLNEILYKYNSQGKISEEKTLKNGKAAYRYTTFYNAKGQKIKYLMEDLEEKTSGIWLFDYDENGNLKYEIDLFPRKIPASKPLETQAAGPPPPPKQ